MHNTWCFSKNLGLWYAQITYARIIWLVSLQVEDAVTRAADRTSTVQDLDFSSLRSQLGSLAAVSAYCTGYLFHIYVPSYWIWIHIFFVLPDSSVHWCCCNFCKVCNYVSAASESGNTHLSNLLKVCICWILNVIASTYVVAVRVQRPSLLPPFQFLGKFYFLQGFFLYLFWVLIKAFQLSDHLYDCCPHYKAYAIH